MNFENVEKEATHFWHKVYAQPFLDKNAERYADNFGFPCIIRAENLPRTVFQNRADLLKYVTEMIRLAENTTWDKSIVDTFNVRAMDEEVALVDVVATRVDTKGKAVGRVYGTYTMNKDAGQWKMVSIFGGFVEM